MKLTIEVPDYTVALSATFIYAEGGQVMMGTKTLDSYDIDRHKKEERDD